MSVQVQVVHKNGAVSPKIRHVCFGFAGSRASWISKFGPDFPPEDCVAIRYFPHKNNRLSDATASRFLKMLHSIGLFHRITMLGSTLETIFKEGVEADITVLSGQEWVGCFELIRNCCNSPKYVEWVVYFHDKLNYSIGKSLFWPKVLLLPPLQAFKDGVLTTSYVYQDNVDTTPCLLIYSSTQDIEQRMGCFKTRARYKPYTESQDYRGVYDFWHPLRYNKELSKIPVHIRVKIAGGVNNVVDSVLPLSKFYFNGRCPSDQMHEFIHKIYCRQHFFTDDDIIEAISTISKS